MIDIRLAVVPVAGNNIAFEVSLNSRRYVLDGDMGLMNANGYDEPRLAQAVAVFSSRIERRIGPAITLLVI